MTTSANLVTVNDALEKLEFLARNRTASERGGYKNNWSAFADRIAQVRCDRCFDREVVKNYRNTLRTSAQNDRIDADTEKIIAELCRFDMRSIAWRSESAKTFKDDYLKARFRLNRLGGWSLAPQISVDILFSENRAADPWPFDIDVVCQRAAVPSVDQAIVVNRAVLSVSWDSKRFAATKAARPDRRQELLESLKAGLDKRGVGVMVYGTQQAPEWELWNVKGQALGIVPLRSPPKS